MAENKENEEIKNQDGIKDSESRKKQGKNCKTRSRSRNRSRAGKGQNKGPKDKNIPNKNDWSFYAINEQIAKDIASLPYNQLPGREYALQMYKTANTATVTVEDFNSGLNSIMVLSYLQTFGRAGTRADNVNIASQQLYTFVRHRNSGAKNYEAADIMMYVMACRDIYREFFEIKRALGLLPAFSMQNRAVPRLLVEAHGIDYDDLVSNYAQYRGQLNILMTKINSLAVPKYFKIFERTAFISSHIFMDSDSIRGQFYSYRAMGYYTWSPITSTTGTSLTYTKYPNDKGVENNPKTTLQSKLNALKSQVQALLTDEDAATISGDILRAFGSQFLYQLASTDEDYVAPIIVDENALAQFENARGLDITMETFDSASNNEINDLTLITQANSFISYSPKVTGTLAVNQAWGTDQIVMKDFMLNSHKDNPDFKDNLEWTRLMVGVLPLYTNNIPNGSYEVDCFGLEIPLSFTVFKPTNSRNFYTASPVYQAVDISDTSTDAIDNLIGLCNISQFDWHPIIYSFDPDKKTFIATGDMKVNTIVSKAVIQAMHDAASEAAVYASDLYNQARPDSKSQ